MNSKWQSSNVGNEAENYLVNKLYLIVRELNALYAMCDVRKIAFEILI